VWPVSVVGRSVSVMVPPSLRVVVDIPGRLAKAWHVPVPPDHGRADLALLQRGLRVLAIAQRGKHDLRAGCRRREDRVESGVASGTGNRLPPGVTRRKMSAPGRIRPRGPMLRRHI
jgi:hypothetical protein